MSKSSGRSSRHVSNPEFKAKVALAALREDKTRFEPVMQGLVWLTQNRCGGRNALTGTDQSDCFKLEFQRVPRPVCLSHNISHEQDYASRFGIHFPGARSVWLPT